MSKIVKCPVRAIARAIRENVAYVVKSRPTADRTLGVELRLQIDSRGEWCLHVGAADYDTDHSGVWGSNEAPASGRFDSMAMARALWNQCVDMAVDVFDGPELAYAKQPVSRSATRADVVEVDGHAPAPATLHESK